MRMQILDIITKKKLGQPLTREEITFFARGAADKTIPDYQLAALLMAIRLNGMTAQETTDLTLAMRDSGGVPNGVVQVSKKGFSAVMARLR